MSDKCEDRIQAEYKDRMQDVRKVVSDYLEGQSEDFWDFGLSFDYVSCETFDDQDEGFFRWQLSWGGPSDEFRFYVDSSPHGLIPREIEYWFLDWFDGAEIDLEGDDFAVLESVFNLFAEVLDLEEMCEDDLG